MVPGLFRRIAVPIVISLAPGVAFVSADSAAAVPAPKPDLVVPQASFIVRTVDAGGDLQVRATIRNAGRRVAKDFVVALKFRGHQLAPGSHIDDLGPGATAPIHVHGHVPRDELPGGGTATVCADVFNTVDEGSNEGNDCKTVGTALVNGELFYKVMSAKADEDSGGTIDCWKVTLDDPVEFKFQSSPEPFDWSFRVVDNSIKLATDGPVTGDVLMPDYQMIGQGGDCTGTVSFPGQTEHGGFTALLEGWRPAVAVEGIKVAWPDIGSVDALGPLDCQVANPWKEPNLIAHVPWSQLDSTEPFILKLSTHVDVKNNGGDCPNAYEYSVKLQRVSETGHPLHPRAAGSVEAFRGR